MAGNIILTLALLASVFTIIMYYLTYKGYTNTLKLARIGYHSMTISVLAASAFLMNAILTHQYQFKYVFNYSNSDLSLGMLMSTFYAGQEGSFMIWLLFTAVVGLILLEYTSKRGDLEPRVMMVYTLAAAFLLLMVLPGLKSPFTYIWVDPTYVNFKNINPSHLSLPFIQGFLFNDGAGASLVKIDRELVGLLANNGISLNEFIIYGKGLNPLLNNFWMQIHPPLLFVGFAMSTVPFAFAFSALIKNEYKDWIKQSLPWLLAGMMVLGLAIMLGGYWAYGILGWGGYWGWDPVENSSLVPWIVGVAAIHTMLIQNKTKSADSAGRFVKTNLLLSILTYVLVLYSTFLTRSGILGDASVHSFAEPGMTVYFLLVLFIGSFIILGFGGIIYRWKFLEKNFQAEDNILSRELALFTGAVALIASAIIIIVGTSAPIFGNSVQISFYNELILPIAIIIGLLNGLSLLIKWKHNKEETLIKSLKLPLIVALLISALIVLIGGIIDFMSMLLTFSAVFALVVNGEVATKIVKRKKSFIGAYVAHTGIAIFMLGVVATGGFSEETQVELEKNVPQEVLGYELTFTGYSPIENGKKFEFNIDVKSGDNVSVVAPVMFMSDFNNSLMREPDILNKYTRDFYVSPVSYDDGGASTSSSKDSHITLSKGDTHIFNDAKISFTSFDFPPEAMAAMQSGGDFYIGAVLDIEYDGKNYTVEPKMINSGGERTFEDAQIEEANLKIEMHNLDASGKVDLQFSSIDGTVTTEQKNSKETLWIEASIKPFINFVWLGVILVVVGFFIAVIRRTRESQS